MEAGDPQLPSASPAGTPSDASAAVGYYLENMDLSFLDVAVASPSPNSLASAPSAAFFPTSTPTNMTPAANAGWNQTGFKSPSPVDLHLLEQPLQGDDARFEAASPSSAANSLQASPPPAAFVAADASRTPTSTTPAANSLQASPPPVVVFSAAATRTPTARTLRRWYQPAGGASPSSVDLGFLEEPLTGGTVWIAGPRVALDRLAGIASRRARPPNSLAENASWWIQTGGANPSSVRDRLSQALSYIRETQRDGDVLAQLWVPVKGYNGRLVLTTSGQPFTLDHRSDGLVRFREKSTTFRFPTDELSSLRGLPGLLGRVLVGRRPEWMLDLSCLNPYNDDERWGIMGLPVFERGSYFCLGVIELIVTRQLDVTSEINTICSALQAVNLGSTEISSIPRIKFSSASYKDALPEMLDVLRAACLIHNLPLAQTWVKYAQNGKWGSRHSDENYRYYISTIDEACYVNKAQMWGFHEICSKHHLLRGQGVAGKAFTTNQPCFLPDIGSSTTLDYPLSHHAKIFNLKGAVAIRVRFTRTNTDFVLEFFLPTDLEAVEEQKALLDSLARSLRNVCRRTLRVVTDKETEDVAMLEMNELNSFTPQGKNRVEESSFGDKSTDCRGQASWTSRAETSQQEPRLAAFGGQVPSLADVQTTVEGSKAKSRTEVEKTVSLEDLRQNMEVCVDKDTATENETVGTMSQEDEQEEEVAGEASLQQQHQPSVIAKAGGQQQQRKRARLVASTSVNPPKSRNSVSLKKKPRKSKVWEHFKIVSPEGADVVEAECFHCHKKLKANSKKNGTSTLLRHLESHASNRTEVSNSLSNSEKNKDGPVALRNYEASAPSTQDAAQGSRDHVREEIAALMDLVVEAGAEEGSDEHYYATQLLIKKEYRDVFFTLKTPKGRLGWLRRMWEDKKKN